MVMCDQSSIHVFEKILKRCQEHLNHENTNRTLGKFNLAPVPPTMYPKLFTTWKQTSKITTDFYDLNDEPIPTEGLIGIKSEIYTSVYS